MGSEDGGDSWFWEFCRKNRVDSYGNFSDDFLGGCFLFFYVKRFYNKPVWCVTWVHLTHWLSVPRLWSPAFAMNSREIPCFEVSSVQRGHTDIQTIRSTPLSFVVPIWSKMASLRPKKKQIMSHMDPISRMYSSSPPKKASTTRQNPRQNFTPAGEKSTQETSLSKGCNKAEIREEKGLSLNEGEWHSVSEGFCKHTSSRKAIQCKSRGCSVSCLSLKINFICSCTHSPRSNLKTPHGTAMLPHTLTQNYYEKNSLRFFSGTFAGFCALNLPGKKD